MGTVKVSVEAPRALPSARSSITWPLLAVGVVAIAARALLALAHPASGLARFEPSTIAENLLAGRGYVFDQYGATYRAWKEPLFPLLLAGLGRAFGSGDLPVAALQWTTGVSCALIVFHLAHRVLLSMRGALAAGLLAAVNPFLLYYDTRFVHPLSFDVMLFLAVVLTTVKAAGDDRSPLRTAGASALVTGAALWERSTLGAAAVAAWAAAIVLVPPRRTRAAQAAVAVGGACLLFAPWVVRNMVVIGRPVITTDAAHVLWLGNNPASNGTYADETGRRVIAYAEPEFRRRLAAASEVEQHDLFLGEVAAFVRRHPDRALDLVLARTRGFFWFTDNAGVGYSPDERSLYLGAYGALLVAGAAGLIAHLRRASPSGRLTAFLLLAAVLGVAAVHALTALNLRHRVPLEMALAVFAGALVPERRRGEPA